MNFNTKSQPLSGGAEHTAKLQTTSGNANRKIGRTCHHRSRHASAMANKPLTRKHTCPDRQIFNDKKADVEVQRNYLTGFRVHLPTKKQNETYQIVLPGNIELVLPETTGARMSQVHINVMTVCSQLEPLDFDSNSSPEVRDVNNPMIDKIMYQLNNYVLQAHCEQQADRKAREDPVLISRKPEVKLMYSNNSGMEPESVSGLNFQCGDADDNTSVYSKLENAAKKFGCKIGRFLKYFEPAQDKPQYSASQRFSGYPLACQLDDLSDTDIKTAGNSTNGNDMGVLESTSSRKKKKLSKKKRKNGNGIQIEHAADCRQNKVKDNRSEETFSASQLHSKQTVECTKSSDNFSSCSRHICAKKRKKHSKQKRRDSLLKTRMCLSNYGMTVPKNNGDSNSTVRFQTTGAPRNYAAIDKICDLPYSPTINKGNHWENTNNNDSFSKNNHEKPVEETSAKQTRSQSSTHLLPIHKTKYTDISLKSTNFLDDNKIENYLPQKKNSGIILEAKSPCLDLSSKPSLSEIFVASRFFPVTSRNSKCKLKLTDTESEGNAIVSSQSVKREERISKKSLMKEENYKTTYLYVNNINRTKHEKLQKKPQHRKLPAKQNSTILSDILADIHRQSNPYLEYMSDSKKDVYIYQNVKEKYQHIFGKTACCYVHSIPKGISASSNDDILLPSNETSQFERHCQNGNLCLSEDAHLNKNAPEKDRSETFVENSGQDLTVPKIYLNFPPQREKMVHVNTSNSLQSDFSEMKGTQRNQINWRGNTNVRSFKGGEYCTPNNSIPEISNNRSAVRISDNSFYFIKRTHNFLENSEVSRNALRIENSSSIPLTILEQSESQNKVHAQHRKSKSKLNVPSNDRMDICMKPTNSGLARQIASKELSRINYQSKRNNNVYTASIFPDLRSILSANNTLTNERRRSIYKISSKPEFKGIAMPIKPRNRQLTLHSEVSSRWFPKDTCLDYIVGDDTFQVTSVKNDIPINIQIYGVNKRNNGLLDIADMDCHRKCGESIVDIIFCRELSHLSSSDYASFGGASLKNIYIVKNDSGSNLHISNLVPDKSFTKVKPFAAKHIIAHAMHDMLMHFILNTVRRGALPDWYPTTLSEVADSLHISEQLVNQKEAQNDVNEAIFISEANNMQNMVDIVCAKTSRTDELLKALTPNEAAEKTPLENEETKNNQIENVNTDSIQLLRLEQKKYNFLTDIEKSKPLFRSELQNEYKPTKMMESDLFDRAEPATLFRRGAFSSHSSDYAMDRFSYDSITSLTSSSSGTLSEGEPPVALTYPTPIHVTLFKISRYRNSDIKTRREHNLNHSSHRSRNRVHQIQLS